MKNLLAIILMFVTAVSFGQTEMKHFQKKCDFPQLLIPHAKFDPSQLMVAAPDSIYTKATVEVKKATFPELKKYRVRFESKDKVLKKVIYVAKKQKHMDLLITQLAKELNCSETSLKTNMSEVEHKGNKIKVLYLELGKNITLSLVAVY